MPAREPRWTSLRTPWSVRALLTHLGVDRFAAVGHGVGGGVAQLLALDGTRRGDAMVLIDSVAFDAWPSSEIRDARRTWSVTMQR